MTLLNLTAEEVLTTTRAVRKRLDLTRPVEMDVIEACITTALQAPSGSNAQRWHFVVVTDKAKRAGLAELYHRAFSKYRDMPIAAGNLFADDPSRSDQQRRVMESSIYLAEHLQDVPVHVIPCIEGRAKEGGFLPSASIWGSLFPAAWSFMLAARMRGLGTSWTTLHLAYEQEAAELLGIPYETVSQGLLIPVAYTIGPDFRPARRKSLSAVMHIDGW